MGGLPGFRNSLSQLSRQGRGLLPTDVMVNFRRVGETIGDGTVDQFKGANHREGPEYRFRGRAVAEFLNHVLHVEPLF